MAIIDVHHHVIGKNNPNAASLPAWNMPLDDEATTGMGITGALLSLPVSATPEITRQMNDLIGGLAGHNRDKYGMLACLPTGFVDSALTEIDYAYDTLGADGFCLPSNAGGLYVGDDRMDPILSELDRRGAVVLLHPSKPAALVDSLAVTDISIYEFPLDTTRAMMDLIYRGKIQKFPNIKWVISHAGGTIPYLAYRLSVIAEENKASALTRDDVLEALRSLYYDLALSTAPSVFATVKDLAGTDHMLFGTDYPLRNKAGVASSIDDLGNYAGFTTDDKEQITSGTAKTLFPRFQ